MSIVYRSANPNCRTWRIGVGCTCNAGYPHDPKPTPIPVSPIEEVQQRHTAETVRSITAALKARTHVNIHNYTDQPIQAAEVSDGINVNVGDAGEAPTLHDSGTRRSFSTGAVRDTGAAKGYPHLIPYYPLERLALHYQAGADKYGKNNWRKGIPLSVHLDSMLRHAHKVAEGFTDEDHAAAVAWNVFAFMWTKHEIEEGRLPKELDDLNG